MPMDHGYTIRSIARHYKISACGYYCNLLSFVPPIPASVDYCKLTHFDTKYHINFIEHGKTRNSSVANWFFVSLRAPSTLDEDYFHAVEYDFAFIFGILHSGQFILVD